MYVSYTVPRVARWRSIPWVSWESGYWKTSNVPLSQVVASISTRCTRTLWWRLCDVSHCMAPHPASWTQNLRVISVVIGPMTKSTPLNTQDHSMVSVYLSTICQGCFRMRLLWATALSLSRSTKMPQASTTGAREHNVGLDERCTMVCQ